MTEITEFPIPTRKVDLQKILDLEPRVEDLETIAASGAAFTSGGPVATASTANLTLSDEQTIDGVTTSASRVLVKDQTAPEDNGIYVTAAGAWARATDMDAAGEVEATAVYVSGGTTQGGMSFATYSAVTTLGTDAITFVQVSNNSGVQDQIDTLNAAVPDLELADELGTAYARRKQSLALARTDKPKAAVVVLVGQSLNAARETIVKESAGPKVKMLVGGAHLSAMDFWPFNVVHVMDWNETASVVEYAEGGDGQSPGAGIASMLVGAAFERVYAGSAAIGGRKVEILHSDGPRCNLYAMTYRLCAIAVADGYDPQVMFSFRQGEADASNGTTQSDYYDGLSSYLQMLTLLGRQSMEKPDSDVPIVMTYQVQNRQVADQDIREAQRRIATEMPNVINRGAVYNVPMTGDAVHPTSEGMVLNGEGDGIALRDYWLDRKKSGRLEITDVTWDGATTAVVTFNHPVVRDASTGVAASISGHTDGFEWFDNGSALAITGAAYQGRTVTLTLTSTPTGTVAQQELRIASQIVGVTVSVPDEVPGSYVRRDGINAEPSAHSPSFTFDTYASPQRFDTVRSA